MLTDRRDAAHNARTNRDSTSSRLRRTDGRPDIFAPIARRDGRDIDDGERRTLVREISSHLATPASPAFHCGFIPAE